MNSVSVIWLGNPESYKVENIPRSRVAMKIRQAVILAAGSAKRAFPLGQLKPKAMYEVIGKPLIQYVVENLRTANITDVVVVLAPHMHEVSDYLSNGRGLGVKIRYVYQESPLGMANAIQAAEPLLDDCFFVVNSNDIFQPFLIQAMSETKQRSACDMVLAGREVDNPWKYGVLKFEGLAKKSRVVGVVEKPAPGEESSNVAVVGAYIFSRAIFKYLNKVPTCEHQLEYAYQKLIKEGRAEITYYNGLFESYKYPGDLLTINRILMDKLVTKRMVSADASLSRTAIIDGNVIIERGVRVLDHAVIRGPVYIGEYSTVGDSALIRDHASIGRHSIIGHSSEIKNSTIGNHCTAHRAYVGDSIIADGCSLGAGTITANYRFDEENVKTNVLGKRADSRKDKLGVIMAENCKTGCNTTTMPGVKVGPNSIVGPGVVLFKDVEPNKMITFVTEPCEKSIGELP